VYAAGNAGPQVIHETVTDVRLIKVKSTVGGMIMICYKAHLLSPVLRAR